MANTSLFSQDCSNLFFSEFVISTFSDDLGGRAFSNSIEIYNPTEDVIHLENYSIKLTGNEEQRVNLALRGYLESGEVLVVSNETASEEIMSKTDLVYDELDFSTYQSVELMDGLMTVDKLGNTSEEFDLENLDIGQLRGLLIRRSRLVKKGTPNFVNEDLLNEWRIYPDVDLDDLGFHGSSCLQSILFWNGAQPFEPEEEVSEFSLFPVMGTIVSEPELDDFCNIFVNLIGAEYQPTDPEALPNIDYRSDFIEPVEFFLQTGFSNRQEDILTPIDDLECNGDVGTGFIITINSEMDECPANALVDFFREVFDVKILEDDIKPATRSVLKDGAIDISPTLTTDRFYLSSENYIIASLRLIDSQGKILKNIENIDRQNVIVELGDLEFNGLIYVQIFTRSGEISIKKTYKNSK